MPQSVWLHLTFRLLFIEKIYIDIYLLISVSLVVSLNMKIGSDVMVLVCMWWYWFGCDAFLTLLFWQKHSWHYYFDRSILDIIILTEAFLTLFWQKHSWHYYFDRSILDIIILTEAFLTLLFWQKYSWHYYFDRSNGIISALCHMVWIIDVKLSITLKVKKHWSDTWHFDVIHS